VLSSVHKLYSAYVHEKRHRDRHYVEQCDKSLAVKLLCTCQCNEGMWTTWLNL